MVPSRLRLRGQSRVLLLAPEIKTINFGLTLYKISQLAQFFQFYFIAATFHWLTQPAQLNIKLGFKSSAFRKISLRAEKFLSAQLALLCMKIAK